MAPTSTRLLDAHASTLELGGSGSGADVYRVYDTTPGVGVTIGQIYNGLFLQSVGIPVRGAPHPELGGSIRVQSLTRTARGNGWDVAVNYANASGSSQRQPIDPLAPGFVTFEETTRREDVDFPIFELRKITVGEGTGAAVEKFVWDLSDRENTERRDVRVLTAVANGELGTQLTLAEFVGIFPIIGAQINKLHTIAGQKWRFVGPQRIAQETESSAEEPARWSIRYEWEQDPGILNATGIAPASGMVFRTIPVGGLPLAVQAFVCEDAAFRIRPYRAFYTSGDPSDPSAPPVAVFSGNLIEDPTGWLGLPGLFG